MGEVIRRIREIGVGIYIFEVVAVGLVVYAIIWLGALFEAAFT